MGQTEINGKTKIVLTPYAFWSLIITIVVGVFSAALSYSHVLNRLDRIADGTVTHVEFQGWTDDLRERNSGLKVPGMRILSNAENRPSIAAK